MKRLSKHFLWLFLSGMLAFPFFQIIYLHFQVLQHQHSVRHSVIPIEKLTILIVDPSDFQKGYLDENEIQIEKKRYDIKQKTILPDGRVKLSVVWDAYEEYLLNAIIDFHDSGKDQNEAILRMIAPDWNLHRLYEISLANKQTTLQINVFYFSDVIASGPWLKWSPPPDQFFI